MRGLFSLIPILFNLSVAAQPAFNLAYHKTNIEVAKIGLEANNTYTVIGVTSDPLVSFKQIFFLNIDTGGTIISEDFWGDPSRNYFIESIVQVDNGLLLSGAVGYGGDYNFYLLKVDHTYKEVWYQEYHIGIGTEGGHKVKKTRDGGYILVGFSQTFPKVPPWTVNDSQVILIKTDSSGNEQWRKIYGLPNQLEECLDVHQKEDSSYVALCTRSAGERNILILHFNNYGDTISSKEFFSPTFTHPSFFLPAGKDSFLIGGIQYGGGYSRAYAMLIDSSFNVVWEKKFGGLTKGQFFAGARQGENLILAGSTVSKAETSGYFDGYIASITKNGSLNWERYINPEGKFAHEPDDYFYDVITTSDGGILAAGFTTEGKASGTQDAWIIKLDSLGLCDTATCWPWLTGISNIPSKEEVQLWAYPNPFHSELKIHIAADASLKTAEWQLWDMNGRIIRAGDLGDGETDFAISAEDIPAGIYFFHMLDEGRRVGRVKVIKAR